MNLSDLLFTNKFTNEFTNENKEENELKDFLKNELFNNKKDITKYINTLNENESNFDMLDSIRNPNLTAKLNRPEWIFDQQKISLSSSVQPLFDKRTDNLKNRYQKHISSYLNIDSRLRDKKKYPTSGNYNIYINKEFRNVQSISLSSIEFREAPTPINNTNNKLTWIMDYSKLQGISTETKVKYSTIIPGAFYILETFVEIVQASINTVQHNIPGNDLDGLYPSFGLYLNPYTRAYTLLGRLEILNIFSLQTFYHSHIIDLVVIYTPQIVPDPNWLINNGSGYPFKPDFEDVPIIMTGLNFYFQEYGNIPTISILNGVPFYTKNQVISNPFLYNYFECDGYTIVGSVYHFKYKLYVYDLFGNESKASYANEYILLGASTNLNVNPAGHPVKASVGRLLPVEILTDKTSTFGCFIAPITSNKSVYVNTNYDVITRQVINRIPWKVIGTGELALTTIEYIFMRIGIISKPFSEISDNLLNAVCELNNNKICKDNSFFAKIIFSGGDPGDISLSSVSGKKTFYDAPLVSMSDLSVQFLLPSGEIIQSEQNHSFTLEITELREVLNDCLIDSRTGNIIDIGK